MARAPALLLSLCVIAPEPRAGQSASAPVTGNPAGPRAEVAAFLERHCVRCHGGERPEAGLDLAALAEGLTSSDATSSVGDPGAGRTAWHTVRARLRADEMPPWSEPRPGAEERAAVLAWLDGRLGPEEEAGGPGRVTLRRLSRDEYERTVRDLLGVDFDAEETFPADEVGHGFDNVGDALSVTPLLLEKHLDAAERIAALALPLAGEAPPVRLEGEGILGGQGNRRDGSRHVLYSAGEVRAELSLAREGQHRLRVGAWAQQAGGEPARMALVLDGAELARVDVTAERGEVQVAEATARLAAGEHVLAAAFVNDHYAPDDPDPENRDRNLVVEWIEVQGPLEPPVPGPFQRELEARLARGSARDAVRWLAGRAWRRPPPEEEVERLAELALAEGSIEESFRAVLVALLVSPRFLFRLELDPPEEPGDMAEPGAAAAGARELDGYELATRLSYFLWSSLPDERLSELAASGALLERDVLRRETERMLRDPRATALAESFAPQWLHLGALARVSPDPARFPAFDEGLRASMRAETELFFEAVLREGRPVRELLEADFTFVDERLARHYGIPGVRGATPRRVPVDAAEGLRGGLLSHASVLTVASNPTRTSPVLRGKWILEALLGTPPPPPPPGVADLPEGAEAEREASLRARLERHRADPACAACHAALDPLGFALEPYDAVGAWRVRDGAHPIDAAGVLPDGRAFDGPAELRALLAREPAFLRALVGKLAVYAVGRGLEPADALAIDALLATLDGPETTLPAILHGIVRLDLFRRREVEEPVGEGTLDLEKRSER